MSMISIYYDSNNIGKSFINSSFEKLIWNNNDNSIQIIDCSCVNNDFDFLEITIRKSELNIVVFTDKSLEIAYLVGYLVAKQKNILVFANSNCELPSFIKKNRTVGYNDYDDNLMLGILEYIEKWRKEYDEYLNNNIKMRYYNKNVKNLLSSQYEEYIKKLFIKNGYEVTDMKGEDIYCDFILTNYLGYKKVLVEVKKMNPSMRLSMNTVEQIHNAILSLGADAGIIITDGDCSDSVKSLIKKLDTKIFLITENDILNFIQENKSEI